MASEAFIQSRAELRTYMLDELPTEVLDVAQRVETWEYEHAEGAIFTHPDGTRTLGSPVVITPQGPRHHEFPVEDHLLHAAYVMKMYNRLILPAIAPGIRTRVQEVIDQAGPDVLTAAMLAAYLHDIEKIFIPKRQVNSATPLEYPGRGPDIARVEVLNSADLRALGVDGGRDTVRLKQALVDWLTIPDDIVDGPELSIGPLRGIVAGSIDVGRLQRMFDVYLAIDSCFMQNPLLSNPQIYTENLERVSRDITALGNEASDVVFGIFMMLSDNIAQGVPPQMDEGFEEQLSAYARFCSDLLTRSLNERR